MPNIILRNEIWSLKEIKGILLVDNFILNCIKLSYSTQAGLDDNNW